MCVRSACIGEHRVFVSCFARRRGTTKGGNDRARARESTWDSRLIADVNHRQFGPRTGSEVCPNSKCGVRPFLRQPGIWTVTVRRIFLDGCSDDCRMRAVREAEAGSGGDQPAKEYLAGNSFR